LQATPFRKVLGKLLASISKYVGEVLNCAKRQNIVGVALLMFVKTCNHAILLVNIGFRMRYYLLAGKPSPTKHARQAA